MAWIAEAGRRFGSWTLLADAEYTPKRRVLARCDCGAEKYVLLRVIANVAVGHGRACAACLIAARESSLRAVLTSAIERCRPTNIARKHYYERGITVCDEWLAPDGFELFAEHIGPRPSRHHSLDRINNDEGYKPGNVRWSTSSEQAFNRSTGLAYQRHRKIEQPWQETVSSGARTERRKRGWTEEEVRTIPRLGPIPYGRPGNQKSAKKSLRARLREDEAKKRR